MFPAFHLHVLGIIGMELIFFMTPHTLLHSRFVTSFDNINILATAEQCLHGIKAFTFSHSYHLESGLNWVRG